MRKITAGLFISLDGVVEAPDQWHFPYFNEEMGAAVSATLGAADTMLFWAARPTTASPAPGRSARPPARRMPPWPRRSATPARSSCRTRSSTSRGGTPSSSRATSPRPSTALKNEPGGTIAMSGSVSVVRQLLAAGLLDELHLLVHPIAVRTGMRLFDGRRDPDPAEADLVRDVQDRRSEPRLRAGRVDGRCHLRGRQGAPARPSAVGSGRR